jgi:hypothetical protein
MAGIQGISTTSFTPGIGSKAFTTLAGLDFVPGNRVKAVSAADPANFMEGVVATYSSVTLTITVDKFGGSGAHTDWILSFAGTGVVTDAGRALRAQLLAGVQNIGLLWLAVGSGDPAWDLDGTPVEDPTQLVLLAETARKQINRVAYLALNDSTGTILFNGHLYEEVAGPTEIVALYANLAESEGPGLVIREEAVFAADAVTTDTPYSEGAETLSPGTMYWLRNRGIYTKGSDDTYSVIAIFEEK